MKTLKTLLRENLLLTEDVKQAEKILQSYNVALDEPEYLRFKELLLKNNSVGYLGFITKLVAWDGGFDYDAGERIFNNLKAFKNHLHLLPKKVTEYDYDGLISMFDKLPIFILMQKLSKKLTNPKLQEQLQDWAMAFNLQGTHFEERLKFFFEGMDSQTQKDILRTSDRFDTLYELLDTVSLYQKKFKNGLEYKTLSNLVKSASPQDVEVVVKDDNRKILLLRIHTFKGAKQVGNMVWCIVRDRKDFLSYTGFGDMAQYFFYHFEDEVPDDEKAVAFTLSPERKIPASMNRSNKPFPNILQHLQTLGIDPKKLKVPQPQVDTLDDLDGYNDFYEGVDMQKIIRESLKHLDLFHLQDTLFQYFELDEPEGPVAEEMRNIINDVHLLNYITSNPDKFLRHSQSQIPRKKALYLIVDKYLNY